MTHGDKRRSIIDLNIETPAGANNAKSEQIVKTRLKQINQRPFVNHSSNKREITQLKCSHQHFIKSLVAFYSMPLGHFHQYSSN